MRPPAGVSAVSDTDLALLARVRAGQPEAEQEALLRFEPLLRWRLRRSLVDPRLISPDDVLQAYRVVLLLCARRWRPEGAAFTTYLLKALWCEEQKLMRRATPGGFSHLGDAVPTLCSLDLLIGDYEKDTLGSLIVDPRAQWPHARVALLDWVRDALADMPEARDLLIRYYGLDGAPSLRLSDLVTPSVSRQTAHNRIRRALRRLRERLELDTVDALAREEGLR